MDTLQRTRILDKLNVLVTISQENEDKVGLALDILVQKILNYCCREDIPPALELIIIEMMSLYVNSIQGGGAQDTQNTGEIKAITRGKTKIEYNVGQATSTRVTSVDDLISRYKKQLIRFKKLISTNANEVI